MHLVDDILYKKIIQPETNLKISDKLLTQPVNKTFQQVNDFKDQTSLQSIARKLNSEIISADGERTSMNITEPNLPVSSTTDTHMTQQAIDRTNVVTLPEPENPDMSIDKTDGGDISPEENCACFNSVQPGREQKRGVLKTPTRKRPISQTESRDIVDHEPKRPRSRSPETSITKEDEYDWDNDPEIPELRERFRKIKYDINYPPPKEPVLKNTKKDRRLKTSTTYLCSICDTNFKYRYQVLRHISDRHPSFAQAPEKQVSTNKALSKEETPPQKRKIEKPDPRRSVKRKSNQEKPYHKKVRTDGRQKRKSNSPDSPAEAKYRKSEIECKLCHTFLKTKKALERHEKNVHDPPKGDGPDLKRKRSNTSFSGSYVKRQRPQPRIPILYQSYF